MEAPCEHLDDLKIIKPKKLVCEKCIKMGDDWVHLRVCQTCGQVNCCDASKNQHATKHYHETEHPVVISGEPYETWAWCYVDETFLEY